MRIFPVLCLLALTGCATVGTKIDPNVVNQFTEGETTIQQALAVMGKPSTTTVSGGTTGYFWTYAHVATFGGAESTCVHLTFGKDGLLKSKTVTASGN